MTIEQRTRDNNKKRAKQIGGICDAAEALGVSRNHLYCVLTGRRVSPQLVKRYQAYTAEQRRRAKRAA